MTFKMLSVCFILIYSLTFINGAKLKNITDAMSLQRLTALRALMASHPTSLAAYIVPTADAHNSEYISPADARREWLSGFTGSAGTAVVTAGKALVWTDGRYYTQFEKEADLKIWTLMKQSLPDTLSMEKWLTSNLTAGSVVGVDPHTMTREEWTPLQTALSKAKMQLIAVDKNLVDQARLQLNDPPPKHPQNDIIYLPLQYTGKSAGQKIKELREKMAEKKASALVITALDEIAYTLNLRGSDISFNPVFFSYLLITPNSVTLFWQEGLIPESIIKYVSEEGVKIDGKPYAQITDVLRNLAQDLSNNGDGEHSIWISNEASESIHRAVSGEGLLKKPLTLISEVSPVALAKLIKNDVELEGFRRCHVRDGIAVVRFFKWLHDQVDAGNTITEIEAAERLLEFRKEEKDFMGPSFETIAGVGENGAIIHYSPSESSPRQIRADDVFLLDSGGQYRDGTTDITRTRHMGDPTDHQKDAFTRVLKGQIGIGAALYPVGVKGNVLDTLARKYLWDVGLDYAHGTGHGVGHFLNVHEGPSGISWRPYPHDPGLKSGQILSNEPGYYKVGEFGIRHEDLVETTLITKNSKHPRASNLRGDYDGRGVLGFNTLTMVPNQRKFMKIELLDEFELNYTNSYHERVLNTLGPILKERGLKEDLEWLEKECAPIKCLGQHIVFGYVPASYYDYPESHTYDKSTVRKLSRAISLERVTAVKNVMSQNGIDAFVIPTADAHNSEYIAPTDARREWVSGLSGSSGTALVTSNHSLVWTDGRYFTQFEIEVDTSVWSLMRQGTDPSIQNWLVSEMPSGSVVGIDPTTYTRTAWKSLETALQSVNIKLQPVYSNIVDEARRNINDPPPPRPNDPLLALSVNFTGQVSRNKISDLVNQIRSRKASALILTALDDIAYTLNIRGSDIPYNPVFFSYLIIKADLVNSNVTLFWGNGNLPSDITAHLQSEGTRVECRPYTEIFDYLRNMVTELPSGSTVWLSNDGSQAIHLAAEVNSAVTTTSTISPVAMMKYKKNSVELEGFRSAHIKDGIAVVRFLHWVHEQVDAGVNVTEINIVDKLNQLRGEEEYYKGPSFATIAGAGSNGAIIHYTPSREGHQTVVGKNDMLLVDSGGQYMDGTTDITRTVHMGTPTAMQRLTFTRVLKGQILLATAVFPRGTFGRDLETLARKSLWDVGLNYAHGTGHGVGHYLNVHEGPVGIGNLANDPGLVPGIIMSNEPGYYEVGEYGIRHEDLVEVIDLTKDSDHIYAKDLVGNFTGSMATAFYTISLAPFQTSCLDVNIMNDDEIKYLNNYHARVLATLGPILKQRNLIADYEWLEKECAPIQRSFAILLKSSPLFIISIFSLWFGL